MYIIRRPINPAGEYFYIKDVVVPPRLSEWTADVAEAQRFESSIEAEATAEYIRKIAFDVEIAFLLGEQNAEN